MADCKTAGTCLPARLDFKSSHGDEWTEKTPYRRLAEDLIHLANIVRPDSVFTVNYFALFKHCPTNAFWTAGKPLLRYLKETKAVGLKYGAHGDGVIKAFLDANLLKRGLRPRL